MIDHYTKLLRQHHAPEMAKFETRLFGPKINRAVAPARQVVVNKSPLARPR